jgi:hypothetical protein
VRTRFTAVRLTLGVLLLAAAGLKLYGLSVSAVPQVGWFAQPWVQLAAAEWELILGLWLLSGSHQRGAWLAALLTFAAFAGVSGYLGFVGVASCGCFGAIQASPWWTFGVDIAVLVLLIQYRPSPQASRSTRCWSGVALAAVAAVLLGLGMWSGWIWSPSRITAYLRGEALTTSGFVDFGDGVPGQFIPGEVEVVNVSDRPIRLVGGTTDCSATLTARLPVSIAPGQAVRLPVLLRVPDSPPARFTRSAEVWTDCDRQRILRLTLVCRVRPPE